MSADRLGAFLAGQGDGLCHTDYWDRVAAIWRTAGAEERADPRWAGVWEQARLAPGSQLGLMTDEERAALGALPPAEREGVVALFLVDGRADVVRAPSAR